MKLKLTTARAIGQAANGTGRDARTRRHTIGNAGAANCIRDRTSAVMAGQIEFSLGLNCLNSLGNAPRD
ncbi:hypothetical protein A9Q94_02005 [Rhodobacterales bacterium 56_14_T64]|nr:hypothetical protein A9Q94_02005 [Rhodobacterales bacterium 56_14_T64]